jgi:hypothetical protein
LVSASAFCSSFRLSGHIDLAAEAVDLAIRLSLGLIAANDAYNLLRIHSAWPYSAAELAQRQRRTKQNPNDQKAVHKSPFRRIGDFESIEAVR